jgi:PadR family transcriptional regulator, regulatory protein PadR
VCNCPLHTCQLYVYYLYASSRTLLRSDDDLSPNRSPSPRAATDPHGAVSINKDLVAASSTPLVLAILAEGDSYGYAILQRVRELSGGELEWTDGMLYPVLHRLERSGLVESRWEKAETGRRRKYYRVTRAGQEQLADERRQWRTVDRTLRKILSAVADSATGDGRSLPLPQQG